MTALFYSLECRFCNNDLKGYYYVGYIVVRAGDNFPISSMYVHQGLNDVKKWQELGIQGSVKAVLSQSPFTWTLSPLLAITVADSLYTVYADHKYEPGPQKAFLAPHAHPPIANGTVYYP
jgi:hypothetical protein